MELYVIRHGQKASMVPDYDGGANPPLTEIGEQQAEHLADFMEGEDIDCLYSSCMLRSLQTAAPVHERIGGEWHVWPVFSESSHARWAERNTEDPERAGELAAWRTGEPIDQPTKEELAEKHGNYYFLTDLSDEFPDIHLSQPFPWPDAWWVPRDGQTHSMGYARVELGLPALLDRHEEGDRVAIVCHAAIGDKMITSLMDFPRQRQLRRFVFDNTGIVRLEWLPAQYGKCCGHQDGRMWWIKYLNQTSHLPPELQV